MISVPTGATHYRMINAVSVVSDVAFDAQSKPFLPTNPALNEISAVKYSPYQSLLQTSGNSISLVALLPLNLDSALELRD